MKLSRCEPLLPVAVQVGGKHLPAGSQVHINIWGVHHDAAHWPQPERFRPERFLPGASCAKDRHPNAFLGFGIGALHPVLRFRSHGLNGQLGSVSRAQRLLHVAALMQAAWTS